MAEVLSAGSFNIVLDDRVYRRQRFLSLDRGVLTTRSMLRLSLSDVRFFFFRGLDLSSIKKRGRYGKFVSLPFRYRGREKKVVARVLSEGNGWSLAEVGGVFFLTRSS